VVGYAVVPFAVAGLETALNANPFMGSLFCFDDMALMMWFGTLSYGSCFLFTMPVWVAIDEQPGTRTPLWRVVVWTLAAVMMIVIVFEGLRHHVGLGDFEGSCLEPIGD
jgi:hypothetical protein